MGATDIQDEIPFWSNRGCCVDIYGPGVNIKSAFIDTTKRNNLTQVLNGTSMAAPHIAGIVLLNKCLYGIDTPRKDREQLMKDATNGTLVGNICIKGCCSPNLLAFNGGCVL